MFEAVEAAYLTAHDLADINNWPDTWRRLRPQMMLDVQDVLWLVDEAVKYAERGNQIKASDLLFSAGFAAGRLDAQVKAMAEPHWRREGKSLQNKLVRYDTVKEIQDRDRCKWDPAVETAATELGISKRQLQRDIESVRKEFGRIRDFFQKMR